MRELAAAPNVVVKISGLGTVDWNWTVKSIRPFVLETIEVFGVPRCMFASNFPVDKLYSDFDTLYAAFREITKHLSVDERQMLFHDNACALLPPLSKLCQYSSLLCMKYASRLNSFSSCPERCWGAATYKPSPLELLKRASTVRGLSAVDLNYPDHFAGPKPEQIISVARDEGLTVNGIAMRYYSDPGFKLGAFTHPDSRVRQAAIDLTKKAMDLLEQTGGNLLTIWLGQDGWEYPFQVDYEAIWEAETDAIREVADHNPSIQISIEYKPSEPRSFSLLSNLGMTLLGAQKGGPPKPWRHAGFRSRPLRRRTPGLCGRADSARKPAPGYPPQRWIRPA